MSVLRGVRRALFPALFLFLLAVPPRAAAQDAFAALKEKAAAVTTLRSDFTQETVIPLFARPMLSYGRFVFKRPDSLLWEFTSPMREGFSLRNGKGVRWEDGPESRVPFAAGDDPVATVIARQLVAWITFDADLIGGEYAIEIVNDAPLRLKMTPLRRDVRDVIASIAITFTPEGPASSLEVLEKRGGRTTITFTNIVVNGPVADGDFE